MTPEIVEASEQQEAWSAERLDAAWLGVVRELERQRREDLAERRAKAEGSEAHLERRVLLRIGELQRERPTLLAWRNEVGLGYQARVLHALQGALAPFGPPVVAAALHALKQHRVAFGQPGSPDLWAVTDGRAAGLELKTERGRLSPVQEQWHEAARRRGVFVAVVRDEAEVGPALERARMGGVG